MPVARRTWSERLTALHAAALYCGVVVALRVASYRAVIRMLDRAYRPPAARPHAALGRDRIVWAVRTVGVYLPVANQCLVEAIVGRCLLRWRGIDAAIRFGAEAAHDGPAFHAWLISGDEILIGHVPSRAWTPLGGPAPAPHEPSHPDR